jgi:hypothetical protein
MSGLSEMQESFSDWATDLRQYFKYLMHLPAGSGTFVLAKVPKTIAPNARSSQTSMFARVFLITVLAHGAGRSNTHSCATFDRCLDKKLFPLLGE